MSRTTGRTRLAIVALAVMALAATYPSLAERGASFAKTSLEGSGRATMQTETVPARMARAKVVVVPGAPDGEAWALGSSSARVAGWDSSADTGQRVFMRYTRSTGWTIAGPPLSATRAPINPRLASFDIARNGDGWAVGDGGLLLHKAPGSNEWIQSAQSGQATTENLSAISLSVDGSSTIGYAVGSNRAVIRLDGGNWSGDDVSGIGSQSEVTGLTSVATVSRDEAWVVATGERDALQATKLYIFRRQGTSWARVLTGKDMFDRPPAGAESAGILNDTAEGYAIAAGAGSVWVGGLVLPRPATNTEHERVMGGASRPFVLRHELSAPDGDWTSYCPDLYSQRGTDETSDRSKVCNEPFPTSPYAISSIDVLEDGQVFAGGLGLFHFADGGWFREPDTNGYLVSVSMSSDTEGWATTSGVTVGPTGRADSITSTIGHWTNRPRSSRISQWAQPQDKLLESVALSPDGKRAIAVGRGNGAIVFDGTGWDRVDAINDFNLHGVAWPDGGSPVAVGERGTIYRLAGPVWTQVTPITARSLYGVAFRSAAEGVAVGNGGIILAYSNGRWRVDGSSPTGADLYAVVPTSFGYLAVGKDATVIEGAPGRWRVRSEAESLLKRPGAATKPALFSVASLGSGAYVMGGQDSAMIVRDARGSIANFPSPAQGTILALAAADDRIFASVSPDENKFIGEALLAAQRGTMMMYDDGRWTDLGLQRRLTLLKTEVDSSAFDDPVYAIAMSDRSNGWAVGGSPDRVLEEFEAHQRVRQTSAVYRVAVDGDPVQPSARAPVEPSRRGVNFAVFGETWCGRGLCTAPIGTGTMPDLVALRIREEINQASLMPNGPKFVLFTGGMRATGVPDELAQFNRYVRGFRIPVFAAPGAKDRFDVSDDGNPISGVAPNTGAPTLGATDFWKQAFADMPKPWGSDARGAPTPAGFRMVGQTNAPLDGQLARTHYAFDYGVGNDWKVRVIVSDTSGGLGSDTEQNPQEAQGAWIESVASAATAEGIPTVFVTNAAPVSRDSSQTQEGTSFVQTAVHASALFASGERVNAKLVTEVELTEGKAQLLIVYAGGGGAPLGGTPSASKLPTDGYYHGWILANIVGNTSSPLQKAQVNVEAIPVLDSVAMHVKGGTKIPVGDNVLASAVARALNGGFSDAEQSKAAYLLYGGDGALPRCPGNQAEGKGDCIGGPAMLPRFFFYSENPEIADFVTPDPGSGNNAWKRYDANGKPYIQKDIGGAAGMLCTFKPGTANINVVAGTRRTRLAVTVLPRTFQQGAPLPSCLLKAPLIPEPPVIENPPKRPIPPEPPVEPETRIITRPPLVPNAPQALVLFPPPPAPAVAPAPPAAPGAGRKEEHEVEFETEKHEHEFVDARYAYNPHRQYQAGAVTSAWMMLASAVALGFVVALGAATVVQRRASPVPARSRST